MRGVPVAEHVLSRPHVWVMDGGVPPALLERVDAEFAKDTRGIRHIERHNGTCIKTRSLEFEVDEGASQLFQAVADFWGVRPTQVVSKFMVSDICGDGQEAHVDHINLDDLDGRHLGFLDLSRQSASPLNPRRVVPTVSAVAYFNSVGGIRFPSAPETGTIAGKRGRIVMFQNYTDRSRPKHDPAAAHYGLYFDKTPKRILVMGILANETPAASAACNSLAGLIYCPGTQQDPLRHDNPSYDCYRSPAEMREIGLRDTPEYAEALARDGRDRKGAPAVKAKGDLVVSLEVVFDADAGVFIATCRSLAGRELCSVTGGSEKTVGWLRAEVKRKVDSSDKSNVVLAWSSGEVLAADQDTVAVSSLVPTDLDEVKKAFANADLNKDGFLDKGETKAMFHEVAAHLPVMTDAEIDRLFDSVDADADGRLNINEFVDWCFGVKMLESRDYEKLKQQLTK